jgi:hypothetical protein
MVILSITFIILYLKFIYILVCWLLEEEKLVLVVGLVSRINYLQGMVLTNSFITIITISISLITTLLTVVILNCFTQLIQRPLKHGAW